MVFFKVANDIEGDYQVLEQYTFYHYASSHPVSCDTACRRKTLCSIRSANTAEYDDCMKLAGIAPTVRHIWVRLQLQPQLQEHAQMQVKVQVQVQVYV